MRTIKKINGKYTEMDTASSSIHEKINFKIQKFRLGKYTPTTCKGFTTVTFHQATQIKA